MPERKTIERAREDKRQGKEAFARGDTRAAARGTFGGGELPPEGGSHAGSSA
jgi:hypothetical protein